MRRVAILLAIAAAGSGAAGASAATVHLGDRGLRLGATGHDVRVLQALLASSGYPATVDGDFGPATRDAVRAFQRTAGLEPSGAVGRRTVAALRAAPVPAVAPAVAPASLTQPPAVAAMIAAGDRIAATPYVWGGGHRLWEDRGYDCSGSVSYVLHGAGLLDAPLDSSGLANWGDPGPGTWVTIYANARHAFMVIAGRRYDTTGRAADGTRWHATMRDTTGFAVRHPAGL